MTHQLTRPRPRTAMGAEFLRAKQPVGQALHLEGVLQLEVLGLLLLVVVQDLSGSLRCRGGGE